MIEARIMLIVTLAFAILLTPLARGAQQVGKGARIGFLSAGAPPTHLHLLDAFREGLRELGYREGQNIAIEPRWAEGKYERLPDLAAELVRVKLDVIVAVGGAAVQAAANATRALPIVMAPSGDPAASGFVASLRQPGGNVTGLSSLAAELSGKRLELLMSVVPTVSRVAVLFNPAAPSAKVELRETEVAARTLRVQLQSVEVREPKDFESAFSAMRRERAGALTVLADPMIMTYRARIVDLVAKHRLPAIFWRTEFAEAGGLMAHGPSVPALLRRAAIYVDKILKGAKPADLPVEQPMKFELFINAKTAKALGLTIPQALLLRADHVIE